MYGELGRFPLFISRHTSLCHQILVQTASLNDVLILILYEELLLSNIQNNNWASKSLLDMEMTYVWNYS